MPRQEVEEWRVEIDLVAAQDGQVGPGVGWQAGEGRAGVAGRVAKTREARPEQDRERALDRRGERARHGRERRPREDLPRAVEELDGMAERGGRPVTGTRCERSVRAPPVNVSHASGRASIGTTDVQAQPGDGGVDDPDPDVRHAADQLGDEQVSIALGSAHARPRIGASDVSKASPALALAGDVADGRPKLPLERLEVGQLLGPDRALDTRHLVVGQDLAQQLDRDRVGPRRAGRARQDPRHPRRRPPARSRQARSAGTGTARTSRSCRGR